MKSSRIPAVLLLASCVGFLWFTFRSVSLLPDPVATHFDLSGQPDGWMSRAGAITFVQAMGLGLPLFIVALSAMIRFLPAGMINIPNREFWLAPERRAETASRMSAAMLWLACLLVCFLAGMHCLTIVANRTVPAHMPASGLWIILAAFLVCLGVWIFFLGHRGGTR